MRPQDIVILLKIISVGESKWFAKDLAAALFISASEVSESLNRSRMAGLLHTDKRSVYRQSLLEFLVHGIAYVFPVEPGGIHNGIPTAHSHSYMQLIFKGNEQYVWPDAQGKVRGMSIEPLIPSVVKAVHQDEQLYLLLALVDVLRVGKVREKKMAIETLKQRFDESTH